ncbi:MAG: hypothetical protein ACHQPI_05890 [Thermoanaerobaculia bacterium]
MKMRLVVNAGAPRARAILLLALAAAAPARAQVPPPVCEGPVLAYTANNEPAVNLPLTITYPALGNASVAGQGSNPSNVGYTVNVVALSGPSVTNFGVFDSDVNEGVPWDDPTGNLTDGHVKSWAIDVGSGTNGVPTYKITITFASPVTGLKFAVTDLDFSQESALVNAFPVSSGGSVIPLTDNLLSDPSTFPALANGVGHATDDAYVVDQTKVNAAGGGLYTVKVSGGISNQTGTVLFAYGDATPVQRVEITYTGSNTGIWIAGMVFNSCSATSGVGAVPTLSGWALAGFALLLALLGTISLVSRD